MIFFWHGLRWKVVSRYLPKHKPFRLLDVGAGAGCIGRYLERDYPNATYCYIEPLKELENNLKSQYGESKDFSHASSFKNIDFTTLLDVLEHQQNDYDFLVRIVNKMDSQSLLLVTVPALKFLWSSWDESLGHFRRYNKTSMTRLIEKLPVQVLEMSYIFPELTPLALIRKWKLKNRKNKPLKEDVEFPDLPKLINKALFFIGSVFLKIRAAFPFGTSLFVCLRK